MRAPTLSEIEPHRPALIGAAVALGVGLLLGAGLKAEVSPSSSYGRQLLVSDPSTRARSAFDDWYPAEGAPPVAYEVADLTTGDDVREEVDKQIERLLRFGADRPAPIVQAAYQEPPVVPIPRSAPQTYAPTQRGDILAASRYEPPPAEPPRWGWALPGADPGSAPEDAPPASEFADAAG